MFGFSKKKEAAAAGPAKQVTLSDGSTISVARVVDCIGDSCPRPQLMTKKALKEAQINDVIEVMIDNPSSVEAIPPMLNDLSATHLDTVKGERHWDVYVRKD